MNECNSKASDRDLIESYLRGNSRAFENLVRRHYQQAYRQAMFWLHDRDAALDVSQEAFTRVYRHLRKFQPDRSFAAWLYSITRNLCRNQLRRRKMTPFSFLFPDSRDSESEAEKFFCAPLHLAADARLEADERRELLWKAISRLSPKLRETLILKEFEEFSYREIGEALEIPIGSVMSRLYAARKKLSELVALEID